ncbi:hypothetical protein DFJ77DRAFT_452377 [Powellomyces hirtus]|nr:hypothetical protein DFJ77DRAFT_452377 [Powellomyces hirtus]
MNELDLLLKELDKAARSKPSIPRSSSTRTGLSTGPLLGLASGRPSVSGAASNARTEGKELDGLVKDLTDLKGLVGGETLRSAPMPTRQDQEGREQRTTAEPAHTHATSQLDRLMGDLSIEVENGRGSPQNSLPRQPSPPAHPEFDRRAERRSDQTFQSRDAQSDRTFSPSPDPYRGEQNGQQGFPSNASTAFNASHDMPPMASHHALLSHKPSMSNLHQQGPPQPGGVQRSGSISQQTQQPTPQPLPRSNSISHETRQLSMDRPPPSVDPPNNSSSNISGNAFGQRDGPPLPAAIGQGSRPSLTQPPSVQPSTSPHMIHDSRRPSETTRPPPSVINAPMIAPMSSGLFAQGNPASKICGHCNNAISGPIVNAMGRTFHPEHFKCHDCARQLGHGRFFEKEGNAYCEGCWQKNLPKCGYCSGFIMERCITALGQHWHPHHFFCAQCGKLFPPGAGFLEKDGMAYCEDDYFNLFAMRCGGCGKGIIGEFVSACGKEWHMGCFACADCKQPFPTGTFYEQFGQPYCATHHALRRGSHTGPASEATGPEAQFCAGCQKHIASRGGTSEVVSLGGKVWHKDCFACSYCARKLDPKGGSATDGSSWREKDGRCYCTTCSKNVF